MITVLKSKGLDCVCSPCWGREPKTPYSVCHLEWATLENSLEVNDCAYTQAFAMLLTVKGRVVCRRKRSVSAGIFKTISRSESYFVFLGLVIVMGVYVLGHGIKCSSILWVMVKKKKV